jgi:hypothetical protein
MSRATQKQLDLIVQLSDELDLDPDWMAEYVSDVSGGRCARPEELTASQASQLIDRLIGDRQDGF